MKKMHHWKTQVGVSALNQWMLIMWKCPLYKKIVIISVCMHVYLVMEVSKGIDGLF
jgi:hypothetical protein